MSIRAVLSFSLKEGVSFQALGSGVGFGLWGLSPKVDDKVALNQP